MSRKMNKAKEEIINTFKEIRELIEKSASKKSKQ